MVRLVMQIEEETLSIALANGNLIYNEEESYWYWNNIRLDSLAVAGK